MSFAQTLEKALDIVEMLAKSNSYLSTKDIAQTLDMPPSTANRFLNTLYSRGYLNKLEGSKKYGLSAKWLSLCAGLISQTDVLKNAFPILSRVRDQIKEAVYLDVVDNNERLCVLSLPGLNPVSATVNVGHRSPLWVSASARVLLAGFDDFKLDNYMDKLEPRIFATNSFMDKESLKKEVLLTRRFGVTLSCNEYHGQRASVAASVRDYTGQTVASLAVAFPDNKLAKDLVDKYYKTVGYAALELSRSLGFFNDQDPPFRLHCPAYVRERIL
ncbi:IclR family transcriptional regulator [Desulfospira joergensenii]|uniref:IclR family transcriptional regulator n=1 Tax=Desulfospira joergensenii TaxID=53329 RepID=UPI0003B410D3|nr:IclR family transcriptional regulator [Desulfospira joergensenii]